MSEKIDGLVDQVAELTVLELSEFIKALEEKFGVEASAPMMMAGAMPAAGGAAEAADEGPTSFNAVLSEVGGQKIQVIKVVREITGLGLKEAKALVDEAPKPIKEDVDEDEGKEIKEKLEAVGASVELQGV